MAPLTFLMTEVFLVSCFRCSSTFSQGSSWPHIEVTPAVIRESDTVNLSCVASQPPHPAQCSFLIQGEKEGVPLTSCQYSVTAQELLERAEQRPPAEITITCSYFTGSGIRFPSKTSKSASLTVLGPSPQMKLDIALKHERAVVQLTCGTHWPPPVSGCHFYFVGKEMDARHTASCQLTVSGRDLIGWQRQNLPIKLQMGCFYYEDHGYGIRSLYDLDPSVEVTELPKPELKVAVTEQTLSQTFSLNCEVYASSPASQCTFYFMGNQSTSRSSASCQLSLTGEQIAKVIGRQFSSLTDVRCFYTINISGVPFSYDHSSSVSVEKLPTISVNDMASDDLTVITCEIYRRPVDVISCNLFIAEYLHETKSKPSQNKDGHSNCIFYVSRADLLKRLQSARGEGVSCNYTVNTKPPTHSTRSAKYIIPGLQPTTRKPQPQTTHHAMPQLVILWVAPSILVVGIFTCVLWRYQRSNLQRPKYSSNIIRQPSLKPSPFQLSPIYVSDQHVEMVPIPVSSTPTVADDSAGTHTMISTMPPVSDEKTEDEQDVSNPYHVYSSIPDTPSVSNQREQTYSLLQDHKSGVTQGMTYSLLQMQ